MGFLESFLLLVSVLLLSICSLSSAQTRCAEENVCTAVCNGKKIDISFLFHKLLLKDSHGNMYDFSCNGDPCGGHNLSTAVCQRLTSGSSYSCGASNTSIWTVLSTDPFVLNITYSGGDSEKTNRPRSSFINVTVDWNVSKPERTFAHEDTGHYTFDFIVPSLSPPKSKKSKAPTEGYIGWILIGLSLIGFLLYFVIGGIIMRFKRGARGIEIIPHVTFWRSFPLLLKDGFLFTISPVYSRLRRGYDRV